MSHTAEVEQTIEIIREVLEEISGLPLSQADPSTSFFDQGLDSLLLTQAALSLSKRFGVRLKLKHLADQYPSCLELARHLNETADPSTWQPTLANSNAAPQNPSSAMTNDSPATTSQHVSSRAMDEPGLAPQPAGTGTSTFATPPPTKIPTMSDSPSDTLEGLVRQQLSIMSRQLELLRQVRSSGVQGEVRAPLVAEAARNADPGLSDRVARSEQTALGASSSSSAAAGGATPDAATASTDSREGKDSKDTSEQRPHGPQLVIRKDAGELTATQKRHVTRLIERYAARTNASKLFTARNRTHVADPRTVAGFVPTLKEMVYPIVVERSSGCTLWDIDGNEYVDLLSGYGSNFFGYGAPFIRAAIAEQMERSMEIGPQSSLVEEVTELFRRFVPADRIAFCNTGSEAVLATFRLARTATGRDLVVMFSGGYHGMFDEVVVRAAKNRSYPAAPGIPTAATDNILVLPWASEEALEVIRERGDEIAAVIVEPVQSRCPEVQPVEFLKQLRSVTEQCGAALIFDEVICGFRVAPGGAQEHFGIQADLATYGKVVGGGISIGIVAGKREFMDALDGGAWQYGDASTPTVGVTYFAGTFVRHPVALAATRAALRYMLERGPSLQTSVNETTDRFVGDLNAVFRKEEAPFEVRHFSSVVKFVRDPNVAMGELFFYHLRNLGVHVWEGRPAFLTEAHTQSDLQKVLSAVTQALHEMQEGNILPRPIRRAEVEGPPVPGARLGRDSDGNPTWYAPDSTAPLGYRPVAKA